MRSPRKNANLFEDLVTRKQEAAEQSAQLRLAAQGTGCDARDIIDQAGARVERLILVLCEMVDFHVVSQPKFTCQLPARFQPVS